jgi:haloalkane dehalogenase
VGSLLVTAPTSEPVTLFELRGHLRVDDSESDSILGLAVRSARMFVENVLPKSILRPLSEEEMAAYRAPFLNPGEDRRPTLSWPRQIPLGGEPPAVCATVERYAAWLAESPLPKLLISGDPGMIMPGRPREIALGWPNSREVTVKGLHFLQEDSPNEIAAAIRDWLPTLAR